MGPGSVNMRDADASDISEEYSDHSGSYGYSSDNDDTDMGLVGSRPSSAKEKPPYRVIDDNLLKKVQVGKQYLIAGCSCGDCISS